MSSPDTQPTAAPTRHRRSGRSLSLEWKLPLVMTAVFAAGLAAFLAFTYLTLVRRAESVIRDRFLSASGQVARTIEAAMAERSAMNRAVAHDVSVTRFVAAANASAATLADSSAAVAALRRIITGRDSLPAFVYDARGRVIASAGKPLPSAIPPIVPAAIEPVASNEARDAVRIGALTPAGSRTAFWVVAPIVVGGVQIGHLTQPRYVGGPRDALESLRALTREDLNLHLRNRDGTGWTAVPSTPVAPPITRDTSGGTLWYERPRTGRQIAEESPVEGTPWMVVIEAPEGSVLARLRSTVTMLALMCLVLIAAGAAVSWTIGRRITRPLKALTGAAEQVAGGTYEHEISVAARDEIGRLAKGFHEMAEQVARAQREL